LGGFVDGQQNLGAEYDVSHPEQSSENGDSGIIGAVRQSERRPGRSWREPTCCAGDDPGGS
jgi:hypothetical protein